MRNLSSTLSSCLQATTRRNHEPEPPPPPRIAPQSPFEEILIQDLSRQVSPSLQAHLANASTMGELEDWLAVSVICRWLSPSAAQALVNRLEGDPRRAPEALASLSREQPLMDADAPAPLDLSPRARRLDWAGLGLQGLAVMGLIALTAIVAAGAWLLLGHPLAELKGAWGTVCWGTFLLVPDYATGPATAAILLLPMAWLAILGGMGPRWLEYLRLLPARKAGIAPAYAGRLEPLYLLLTGACLAGLCSLLVVGFQGHRAIFRELPDWQMGWTSLWFVIGLGMTIWTIVVAPRAIRP